MTSLMWYLYLLIIGLLFFPLTARVFKPFIDHGYPFAKTIGIIIISYVIFILGILHLLPFTKEALFLVILVTGFLIYRYFKKEIQSIRKLSKKKLILLAGEELLFLLSFIALLFVRGQEPSIHGLEKFMDFGFIQSINKSTYFPPVDMWLSADPTHPEGYPINYYYFGHLTGAMLIKLSGISPFIGYNLILATIFAQGITLVFSLASSIVRIFQKQILKRLNMHGAKAAVIIGLLASFIVNLGGNLHTIYIFTTGYQNEKPVPFWNIFQSLADVRETMVRSELGFIESLTQNASYWYPNATRFIPFTIHEFPAYSYVVADLHGHVFDIPFVLLTLALLFMMTYSWQVNQSNEHRSFTERIASFLHSLKAHLPFSSVKKDTVASHIHTTRTEILFTIGIGAMIAVNYMTNAFDGPIYLLLAVVFLFFHHRISWDFLFHSIVLFVAFALFSLPFSIFFEPFATGIGVNCSPDFLVKLEKLGPFLFEKDNCQTSAPWMMGVLWGFFWMSFILLGIYLYVKLRKEKRSINFIEQFLLIIFGYGTFLVIIPEFVYAKDIYPAHFRANTLFKLGYQAFMMMGVASAVVYYLLGQWKSAKRYILKAVYIFFFSFVLYYPFLAFPSYYPGLYDSTTYQKAPELDGSVWMDNQLPQDKELIDYINENITKQVVILEAQGDSYTDFNRISAYTGNPTVAGWWVHEWLWRGSADVVGSRIPDIEALYQSDDITETRNLINKYQVEYVVISKMEREKYKTLNEEKFSQLGSKVFETTNGLGALYKVY